MSEMWSRALVGQDRSRAEHLAAKAAAGYKLSRDEIRFLVNARPLAFPEGEMTLPPPHEAWPTMSPIEKASWLSDARLSTPRSDWVLLVSILLGREAPPLSEDDVTAIVREKNHLVRENASLRARLQLEAAQENVMSQANEILAGCKSDEEQSAASKLMSAEHGAPPDALAAGAAMGLSFIKILALVRKYGPVVLDIIKEIKEAIEENSPAPAV